jgi:hypothetical protein
MHQNARIYHKDADDEQHRQTKPKEQRIHDSLRSSFNAKGKRAIMTGCSMSKGDVS